MGMEAIIQRLEAQRNRLKGLFFYHGVAQLLLRLLGLAVILFILDYAVDPPRGARIIMTLGALGYLFYAAYRYLMYPLSRHFTNEDMALAMESKYPELDGGLVSGLQFHASRGDDLGHVSPALMRAAVEQAERRSMNLPWRELFDTRRIRKLLLVAAVLFFIVTGYAFMHPDHAGIWAVRMMGGAREWPRRTTLLVHLDERGENYKLLSAPDPYNEQSVLIARGTSLPMEIEVEGRDPGEVLVFQEGENMGKVTARATRRGDNMYRYRFRNIRKDMEFWVEGGDDDGDGRLVDVSVRVPPQVLSIQCSYTYPEYLGLPPETTESPQIEGPEGTRADLRIAVSRPATEAEISLRAGGKEEIQSLLKDEGDPLVYRHTMKLEKSGSYRIGLLGEEGFGNTDAPVHSIIVKKDASPRVRLYSPRKTDLDAGPRAVVVFRAAAEDDYGVASMQLRYKGAGQTEEERREFEAGELDVPYGSKRITSGYVMDFEADSFAFDGERRRLQAGDALIYTVEAFDARPDQERGRADTGQHIVNIVSDNEKIRLLTERQIRLKEKVRENRNLQSERLERTEAALEDQGEEVDWERVLLSLEIGQNQLTGRYKSVSRDLAYVFDEYLFNRLDKTAASASLLQSAVQLRLESPVADGFDVGLYTPLVELFESGRLGQMDLMERLCIMLSLSMKISEELSPGASKPLARGMVAPDPSDVPDLIRESAKMQRELLRTLDLLLEKMEEWEDYQELLQLFRDLIDSQHNVNILTREELRKRR